MPKRSAFMDETFIAEKGRYTQCEDLSTEHKSIFYCIKLGVIVLLQLRWMSASCQCVRINDAVEVTTAGLSKFSIALLHVCCTLRPCCVAQPVVRPYLESGFINKVVNHRAPQKPGVPFVLPRPLFFLCFASGPP